MSREPASNNSANRNHIRPSTHSVRTMLNDRSGLTLLETIVALAILSIGIVGVLHVFSSSMVSVRAAEDYSTAATLANQVAANLDRTSDLESGQLSGTFEDMPGYVWDADVQSADDNGLMKTVIVVTWQTGKTERHYQMVTCLRPSTTTTSSTSGGS